MLTILCIMLDFRLFTENLPTRANALFHRPTPQENDPKKII